MDLFDFACKLAVMFLTTIWRSCYAGALQYNLRPEENRRMTDTVHTTDVPAAPKTMLDIADIQRILPHRYPFLLIDRVIEMTPKERIVAIKNVTINEPFFQGHFPNMPIMPGV